MNNLSVLFSLSFPLGLKENKEEVLKTSVHIFK